METRLLSFPLEVTFKFTGKITNTETCQFDLYQKYNDCLYKNVSRMTCKKIKFWDCTVYKHSSRDLVVFETKTLWMEGKNLTWLYLSFRGVESCKKKQKRRMLLDICRVYVCGLFLAFTLSVATAFIIHTSSPEKQTLFKWDLKNFVARFNLCIEY